MHTAPLLRSARNAITLAAEMIAATVCHAGDAIAWKDITESTGLKEPLAGIMGHGGAVGDFDGDGKPDLFIGGFCDRPNAEYAPAVGPVSAKLFRNLGDGRFATAGQPVVEHYARTSGAVFADLDNNGTLELYVANNAQATSRKPDEPQRSAQICHSKLFRNDAGKFTDISATSGACPETLLTARNVGVFDYDRDGLLDLFVVEDKFRKGGSHSTLFRNLGNLTFAVVNEKAGIPTDIFGLGLAVADVNADGYPDFFVPHGNRLFLSKGDGTYREATELKEVFAYKPLDGEDWPCGAAFGDLNRDGRLDLVISGHHKPARNRLFLHSGVKDGVPQFREVTQEAGLAALVGEKCPHVEIQDFDNDGWPDIYVSAAWRRSDGSIVPHIYRNTGVTDGIPRFALPEDQGELVYFPAGPSGDIDADGRLDLFLVNWFSGNHSRLLRNESTPTNHWIDAKVTGKRMNRMGIGAQARVYTAGKLGDPAHLLGYQEIGTGYGYASGQPAIAHFGLGTTDKVDVEITLPDGTKLEQRNATSQQTLNFHQP